MKDCISMIPRIKGKTSNASSLYLVFLLLLSGDIELNPGPGDPRDILRVKSDILIEAFSKNLDKVVVKLNAKKLIPQQAADETSIAAYSNYRKAATLVSVLQSQLSCSSDSRQYFIDLCNVLKDMNLGDETLATLADDMLDELGSTQQVNGHFRGRASNGRASNGRTSNGRTSNGRATAYTSSQSALTITDLKEVLNDLRKGGFSDKSYYDLGLELGLHRRTLDNIKTDNYIACLRECIAKWLERADDVDDNGGTNWASLCHAVEKINKAAADYIRDRHHIMPSGPSQPIEQTNHQDNNEASQMTSSDDKGLRYRQKPSDATDNESKETEETDSTPPSNPLVPEASSDKQLKWYKKKSVIALVFCLMIFAFVVVVVDSVFLNGYIKELLLAIIKVIHHFK